MISMWNSGDAATDTRLTPYPVLAASGNRSYEPEEILAMINSTDGLLMASALMVVFFGGSNVAGMLPGADSGMREFKKALDQVMGTDRSR